MKKDKLDEIADALVYEALNILDGASSKEVEHAEIAGEAMQLSGIGYDLPTNPQDTGILKDFKELSEDEVKAYAGEVVEDLTDLSEDAKYEAFVSSLNESLTSLGFEEYGQILEEVASNPTLEDMSRLFGIMKHLIKEGVDDVIVEQIYLFSTALMSLTEEEKELNLFKDKDTKVGDDTKEDDTDDDEDDEDEDDKEDKKKK